MVLPQVFVFSSIKGCYWEPPHTLVGKFILIMNGSLGQKRRFYFLFFQQRTQRILEWFAVLKPFRQYAVYAPRPSFDLVYLVKWSVLAKISFWSFLDNTGSSFCSFSFCYKTFFLTEILPDLLPSNICSITFMFHQIPEISRQVLLKQCLHYS